MIFMLICTEGDVSEPALIRAIVSGIAGQAPTNISMNVEILPLPLGGNQGHTKLVEAADLAIAKHSTNGLVSLAAGDDEVEKWIVVDYDNMESHKVDPIELRRKANDAGYTLIINRPNFEFFVLAALSGTETALSTPKNQFKNKIDEQIDDINNNDKEEKGFTKDMLMPRYTKKKYVAQKLFSLMVSHHPEYIDKMASLPSRTDAMSYTEMPIVVQKILDLYSS